MVNNYRLTSLMLKHIKVSINRFLNSFGRLMDYK